MGTFSKLKDLTGKVIGNWTVIKRTKKYGRLTYWTCKCQCGAIVDVYRNNLTTGKTSQCIKCSGKQSGLARQKFTNEEKYCSNCEKWKPLDDFCFCKSKASGRGTYCKICVVSRKHHITPNQYEAILKQQKHLCAIIGCTQIPDNLDHDHSCCPGKRSCGKCIRGALCTGHNLGLGNFHDDEKELESALSYLQKYKELKKCLN